MAVGGVWVQRWVRVPRPSCIHDVESVEGGDTTTAAAASATAITVSAYPFHSSQQSSPATWEMERRRDIIHNYVQYDARLRITSTMLMSRSHLAAQHRASTAYEGPIHQRRDHAVEPKT